MFSYLKKPSVYISLFVAIALIAAYTVMASPKKEAGDTVIASTGSLSEEVFITGTVKADRKVSLSFDRSGSIESLPYPVGTQIDAGIIIASLQNETERAAIEEQEALVSITQTKLAKVNQGTRSEEISLKEAEVQKAKVSLENSTSKTSSVLSDAYSAAEEALSRYADPFFSSDDTVTPRLTYVSGTQDAYDAERKRLEAGESVKHLQKLLSAEASSEALGEALKDVRVVQDLFITLGLTLREGSSPDAATLTDYRTRVTNAREALGGAITLVQNQMNSLRDTEAEFDRTVRALELAKAKATPEAVTEAEQELRQAEAKLRGVRAAFEKTLLRAPFKGRISSKHVEIGETVSSGDPIIEFLGVSGFIIEANVPEADIAKISKRDLAEATLDAYGNEAVFKARVIEIDPAETEIDGVATYKTKLSIDSTDSRIRSGMTANVTIKKLLRENTVIIPSRAVMTESGTTYALKLLPDGTTQKVQISIGAKNGTGDVEVLEGISSGDIVIIPSSK